MQKGKFIVIDGTYGSRRVRQALALELMLKREGIPSKLINPSKIDSDNLEGSNGRIPYVYERAKLAKSMRKDLDEGINIISSSWIESYIAFVSAEFSIEASRYDKILELERHIYERKSVRKPLKPDATIFLYMPHQIAEELEKSRRRSFGEIKPKNIKNFEDTYLVISGRGEWHRINCATESGVRKAKNIAEEIYSKAKEILEIQNT